MRASVSRNIAFYNNVKSTVGDLRAKHCKEVVGMNPNQFDLTSNEGFWNSVLCKIPESGILKIEKMNLCKKPIPKEQIWTKYQYTLDKNESTDDYLVVPQPQHSVEIEWGQVEKEFELRHGVKNENDPNRKYIENITNEMMKFKKMQNNHDINKETLNKAKAQLLTTILTNSTQYYINGGKSMLLIHQDGWSLEDKEQNEFNLSEIPPNYGLTSVIRKEFFKEENENNNYHKGITGVQNFIGSPMMMTAIHKEHGGMKSATHSFTGNKLWIFVKESNNGAFSKFWKDKFKKNVDCCVDVHHFEKEIFWDFFALINNGELQVRFTTQEPGETIVVERDVFHQVVHLGYTEAVSIDYSPNAAIDWQALQHAAEIQEKYEQKHLKNKCIRCPMSPEFGGDKFCSDLIKYDKLSMIKEFAKRNNNNNNNNKNQDNDTESINSNNNSDKNDDIEMAVIQDNE